MLQTSTVYYYLILFHMMSSVLQGIMFVTLFRLLQIFGLMKVSCQKTIWVNLKWICCLNKRKNMKKNVLHSLPFVYFLFFFIFVKMGSHDCFSQNPKTGSDGFPWTKSTEPQKRFP